MAKKEVETFPGLKTGNKVEFAKKFGETFKIKNTMLTPKIEKVMISVGASEAVQNPKCLEFIQNDITLIAGQKPVQARARKSVAGFKLREGQVIGVFVTLRGKKMDDFLARFINVAIPRIRDFKGFSERSFDKTGNFTIGLKEQLVFTEIDLDKTDKVRGLSINLVTTAKQKEHAKFLLEYYGIPFQKRST